MASNFNLAQIEAYLNNTLTPEERTQFEQALQAEPELAKEVAAYRKLMTGFSGLKSENFGAKLQQWNNEWNDYEEEESIEWYIQGQLSAPLAQQLEAKMETDDAFKRKVNEYRTLFSGFSGLHTQAFADKLTDWEAQASVVPIAKKPKVRRLWPRLAVAASVLLVVGMGLRWYAQSTYANHQLFEAYYTAPKSENTLGNDAPGLSQVAADFAEAHQNLQADRPEAAAQQFEQLLTQLSEQKLDDFNQKYYTEQTEWNLILAQLKTDAPKQQLIDELQAIADQADHSFQAEARALQAELQSFWYFLGN